MKITKILTSISLTIGITIFAGCDSDTPLASNGRFTLEDFAASRFNLTELELNRGQIADMPSSLTSQDLITYTPGGEDYTVNNVNPPRTNGEADWVLRPSSTGSIVIEQRRYDYTRPGGNLKEANLELARADKVDGPEFDIAMASLAATGEGRPNSLSTLLTTSKYPVNSASIFNFTAFEKEAIREAVTSLGYVAVDMPFAFAVGRGRRGNEVQVDVDNIVVLTGRTFNHVVTSTNADILDSGEIRGTFTVLDTYYDLAVEASVNDVYYRVIIARIPVFSDILQVQSIQPFATGNFVIELGSLTNSNPNPNPNP